MEAFCRCSLQGSSPLSFAAGRSQEVHKTSGLPICSALTSPSAQLPQSKASASHQVRCRPEGIIRGATTRLQSRFLISGGLHFRVKWKPARWQHRSSSRVRSLAKENQETAQKGSELEVAVFRFTLGIPGVEDALLPRILGCLVGVLLLGNHLATPAPIADAQLRSEALGAILAVLACVVPYLSRRLQEGKGGRRTSAAAADGSTREVFVLDPGLDDVTKQQLAWTTYSLLKNTRTKTVLISDGRRVLCVRGSICASVPQASTLDVLTDALESGGAWEILQSKRYLQDRGALASAGVDKWSFIPASTSSAFFQGDLSASKGSILLLSDQNRFVSPKERIWVEGLASRALVGKSRGEPLKLSH